MQIITSPEVKHTEQDTAAWVPANGLEQVGRAYARIIDRTQHIRSQGHRGGVAASHTRVSASQALVSDTPSGRMRNLPPARGAQGRIPP